MADKKKKHKSRPPEAKSLKDESDVQPLSAAKKRIFWIITLSLPIILIVVLEAALRIFNYGGDVNLFIGGPVGYENYIRCNPEVARRYFSVQSSVPTPPKQLFLKHKPQNGYRIFVLGESSAAGFPYGNNASFPNILERALSKTFPEKNIEVINVSMAAINSFTLLDFMDEILDQSPDAILIYTGHNEYYGALGVGSEQSLGSSRWLIRSYLKLRSIKTVMLMRNFVDWLRIQFANLFYKGSEVDPSATLMERMVADQSIPYGSPAFENGKEQFRENLDEIIRKAKDAGVKVILSELVSNLRDQAPFISLDDKIIGSAKTSFENAQNFEKSNEFGKAKQSYKRAKDLDALRFRAPEVFNTVIHELSQKYSVPVVSVVSYFEKDSPNGLIGNGLMLEHLHPNQKGYFLIAKAFYDELQKDAFITLDWPEGNFIDEQYKYGVTELDSVYASIAVRQLKSGWPFHPKSLPNRFLQDFKPADKIEETAFRVLQGHNFSLEAGHLDLGKFYEKNDDFDKAYREYNALITSIPDEQEFYERAATVLIKEKDYGRASNLLFQSLKYKENPFAYKWIGQIALMKKDYKNSLLYLSKANSNDPQVIFNMARAYYLDNQIENGDKFYEQLRYMSPKSQYISYLSKMKFMIKLKGKIQDMELP